MKRFAITVSAYAAALVILTIPVLRLRLACWFAARGRHRDDEESGMTFIEIEAMSDPDLHAYLHELACACPIELPRYCCPIVEFRRLEPDEINVWLDHLHRREKLALAASHCGCVKWNQRF